MPKRIVVELNADQLEELENARHQHRQCHIRERAAAVLKVAGGQTVTEVAERGLLIRHEPETVHKWIKNYLENGLAGWQVKSGRGRKASFSPSDKHTGS